MTKLRKVEKREKAHPPFKQFFGIHRNPIATNPLRRAK
jgi:hypothetical protein